MFLKKKVCIFKCEQKKIISIKNKKSVLIRDLNLNFIYLNSEHTNILCSSF